MLNKWKPWPAGGKGNIRGSPKSSGVILWGPWSSAWDEFVPNHLQVFYWISETLTCQVTWRKNQMITTIIVIHPLRTVNIWATWNRDTSDSAWDVTVWTWPTRRTKKKKCYFGFKMGKFPRLELTCFWSRVWFLGNNRIMFSFAVMSGIEWGTADEKQKESEALKQLFIEALAAVHMIFFSPLNCLTWKIFRSQREKKKNSPVFHHICFPSASLHFSFDPRISTISTSNGYRGA